MRNPAVLPVESRRRYTNLFHVSDWLPTLLSLARPDTPGAQVLLFYLLIII